MCFQLFSVLNFEVNPFMWFSSQIFMKNAGAQCWKLILIKMILNIGLFLVLICTSFSI